MSQSATRELALAWPTFTTLSPACLPGTQKQTADKYAHNLLKGKCALKQQMKPFPPSYLHLKLAVPPQLILYVLSTIVNPSGVYLKHISVCPYCTSGCQRCCN